jgi:hypothetical protein
MQKLGKISGVENLWIYEYRTISKLNTTPFSLYQKFKPDIVICYAHAGHFDLDDIRKITCPKVCIEVDYYKSPKSKIGTYQRAKFDLILQRGSFRLPEFGIPTAWLPFSADTNVFSPLLKLRRKENCVGLAASINAPIYSQRKIAANKLQAAGLLNICKRCFGDVKYSTFLRKTRIILTSTEINSPHGKLFETMASGSVALTSDFNGEQELFGSTPCFIKYRPDCSDIVEQAKFFITHPISYQELQLNSIKVFQEKHTDDIRLKELYQHLENLLQGKPVVKPWGF